MSEKAKGDKPSKARVNRYGFLLLWVGSQLLGWLVFFLLNPFMFFGYPMWLNSIIIGLSIGIPTAIAQKLSLRLYFGRWFRGWIRANTLAWMLSGLGIFYISDMLNLNPNEQISVL